jgi:hypothetical protein
MTPEERCASCGSPRSNHPYRHPFVAMKLNKVTIEEAQSHIDGLKVAEIIRDAQVEFRDEYPDHVLALGVGPIQTMLGLAIKNGHINVKKNKKSC